MSTSRAKRKRKQRARSAAAHPGAAQGAPAGAAAKGVGARGAGAQGAGAKPAGARGAGAQGAGAKPAGAQGANAKGARQRGAGAKGAGPKARAKGDAAESPADVRDGVARPQPIWAPFPLTEIGIAAGVIIFGAGFEGNRPTLLAIAAVVLAVVVGELCLREHFAGFRSHALLLAALAVAGAHTIVALAIADAYRGPLALVIDLALLGGLAWWLRGRFRVAHERAVAAA